MVRISIGLLAIALLALACWLSVEHRAGHAGAPSASAAEADATRAAGARVASRDEQGATPNGLMAADSAAGAPRYDAEAQRSSMPSSMPAQAAVAAHAGAARRARTGTAVGAASSTSSDARPGQGASAVATGATDGGTPAAARAAPANADAGGFEDPPQPKRSDPHLAGGAWIIGGPVQRPYVPVSPMSPKGDG